MKGFLEQHRYIEPGEETQFATIADYVEQRWIAALGAFCRRTGFGVVTSTRVTGEWQADLGWWLMMLRVELTDGLVDVDHLRAAVNADRLPELARTAAPITQAARHRGAA